MTRLKTLLAVALMGLPFMTQPALAHDGVKIVDAYARIMGESGAIFLTIENHQADEDRLVSASTDAAEMTGVHTHIAGADGVMKMREVSDGFAIPAKGEHALQRGGDHIMLMGVTRALKDGDLVHLTLTFERAGVVEVDVPVDNARQDAAMDHGAKKDHAAQSAHGTQSAHGAQTAHGAEGAHGASKMVDTHGMTDPEAITAVMKSQFDTPENPLTVDPIVVEGDYALASWAQGEKGGRALLQRRDGVWQITLCGGADLRLPEFLTQQGVSAAEALSKMFNAAEDGLGADKVKLSSSFEGVVMISPAE